jgi:DNA/RNA endonuclease YhcR with UshA esterase domain
MMTFCLVEVAMRALLIAVEFSLMVTPAAAQIISCSDVQSHVGQNVTVEGAVSEVHHAASGSATFLDMCGRYPNNAFTGVIFKDDENKFPNVDSLDGKTIDVTGVVSSYKGKSDTKNRPEIILSDPAQVKVK